MIAETITSEQLTKEKIQFQNRNMV